MHPIITGNLEGIRALARDHGVRRLEVFGSVCTDEFDPETNDVDFLVGYPENDDFGPWIQRVTQPKAALAALLGRKVDLVMAGAPRNPYFIRSMNQSRRLLYAA